METIREMDGDPHLGATKGGKNPWGHHLHRLRRCRPVRKRRSPLKKEDHLLTKRRSQNGRKRMRPIRKQQVVKRLAILGSRRRNRHRKNRGKRLRIYLIRPVWKVSNAENLKKTRKRKKSRQSLFLQLHRQGLRRQWRLTHRQKPKTLLLHPRRRFFAGYLSKTQ